MKRLVIVLVSTLMLGIGSGFAQTTPAPAAPGAGAAAAPTDPQIAHIVVTANQIDIDGGKLAQSNASSKEVEAFGKQMVADHTGVNQRANTLAKKLKVTPEDNATSKSLKSNGDSTLTKLKGMKGKDFDKAYIDNEVTFHQTVLDTIDQTLLPNAKNDELKALIRQTRPAIVAHLEHAKQLQSTLAK